MRTLHLGDLRLEKLHNGAIEIRIDKRFRALSLMDGVRDRQITGEQFVATIDPQDVPKLRELVLTGGAA